MWTAETESGAPGGRHREPEREGENWRLGLGRGRPSFCAADSKLSKLMVFLWFCSEGEEEEAG